MAGPEFHGFHPVTAGRRRRDCCLPMTDHPHISANPDPTFAARSRSTWEIVRRVAVYLRPYKGMALANVGCAVLSLAFALVHPQLVGLVIDRVIIDRQSGLLAPAMLGLLGAFLLRDLF